MCLIDGWSVRYGNSLMSNNNYGNGVNVLGNGDC